MNMKWILMATAVTIAVCASALGEPKDKSDKPGGKNDEAVMRIEKELLDSILKSDAAPFQRYLAETYMTTGPDGMVQDKAQFLADLKSGDLKLEAASFDDLKIGSYGDTTIVTYGSNDKGTYKGKDISGKTRWTDVFVKRNGQWQLVSSHGSRVTP